MPRPASLLTVAGVTLVVPGSVKITEYSDGVVQECLDCGKWGTAPGCAGVRAVGIAHGRYCAAKVTARLASDLSPEDLATALAPVVAPAAPVAPVAPVAAAPSGERAAIVARYAGRCACGAPVRPGERIFYASKRVQGCGACSPAVDTAPLAGRSTAGAIARQGGASSLGSEAEIRDLVDAGFLSVSDAMNRDY